MCNRSRSSANRPLVLSCSPNELRGSSPPGSAAAQQICSATMQRRMPVVARRGSRSRAAVVLHVLLLNSAVLYARC